MVAAIHAMARPVYPGVDHTSEPVDGGLPPYSSQPCEDLFPIGPR
jgi:hypothetical protein